MKYRFMFNGGWWLKIDNKKDLLTYHNEVDIPRMADGLDSYFHAKEFFDDSTEHASTLGFVIGLNAMNAKTSGLESVMSLLDTKYNAQLECIENGQAVYVNNKGGWFTGNDNFTSWCDRSELVFPSFKKDQIRVKQFPGGEHFYAYIDDMQVRDNDVLKWNTYEEAYNNALRIIENTNN